MTSTIDFDYSLPEEAIAQEPLPRGRSRLLHLDEAGRCHHHRVGDLPGLLHEGDLLVVNDTKVIPARLLAQRPDTGGRLELLLVDRLSATGWVALARPGKRARPGARFELDERLEVEVTKKLDEGRIEVAFSEPVEPHLDRLGHVPLPPYIRRDDQESDHENYQTVFASRPGAVAAPTAGLHFTRELLDKLRGAGIGRTEITLHVGIGTFRPVTVEQIESHRMEAERFVISESAAAAIHQTRANGGRIVAVGTTVVRTLESAIDSQGRIRSTSGRTDLFIRPGFSFQVVDALLTNFNLPRSTLLMLVSAFAGREPVLEAYRQALAEGYRFYSYGDCMLVEKPRSDIDARG